VSDWLVPLLITLGIFIAAQMIMAWTEPRRLNDAEHAEFMETGRRPR
jgi:hypothetical protein